MVRIFIDSNNLGKKFAEAGDDLKNGTGSKLYELAGILDSIARVTGDPIFFTLPQALGGFSNVVMQSRKMVTIPMLPKELRDRLSTTIGIFIVDAMTQIDRIGMELAKNPNGNPEIIIDAIGRLHMQTSKLHQERGAIMPVTSSHGHDDDE